MARRSQVIWTFAITSIALFMVTLDNLVVTTALPVIRHDLNANLQQLEWTINAYTLTFAVLLLTGAALGDRFGRRRIFSIGLAIFTLGSAASALAQSPTMLIVARAVQGAGAAMVTPLTLTILSAAVPANRRGVALGAWGGIGGLAVAVGPIVGGAIVQGISWHWIFWVNVPIGLAARAARAHPAEPRRAAPTAISTSAAWSSPAAACSRSSGASCAPISRDGRARRSSGRSPAASLLDGGVRHLRAPLARADAAHPLLQQPDLQRRQRGLAVHVLRHVRQRLPARAVLPDGARTFAAGRGLAHPSVDGDADHRGADRRCALRPHQRPHADGDRPGASGDRAASGSATSSPRRRRTRPSSCPSSSAASAWACSSHRWRTSCSARCSAREEGKASGREQRHPRARRRARRDRARVDLRPLGRLRLRGELRGRAHARGHRRRAWWWRPARSRQR